MAKVIKEFIKNFLVTTNSPYKAMFNLIMEKLDIIYDETSSARKVTLLISNILKKKLKFIEIFIFLS